ncbi:hypothetical protein [Streptomyces aidingensis]|uniref:Uncharacterized protein n=1 Tax=Streptomyces aidingensis TaxID=910347 RepID=A0A1I1FUB5_9ACTN|nr:hypothetical protein [Streptomyces aidingensis]SFC02895.1 hypothetical protein SAMN05421773_101873 [Streptomyces aidingensis]
MEKPDGGWSLHGPRCAAADAKDPTPCQGPSTAVTVVDGTGREVTGCRWHSARLLASDGGARLHPMAGLLPCAVDIYCHAGDLPPFAWQVGR